jgi:uncharacterized DUF497 family protein
MNFEYDPAKSKSNKAKHGIDFEEAKRLWDSKPLEIPSAYREEHRALLIGRIDDKHWTAVITRRTDAIRIISCRRSRKEEVEWYEEDRETD